MPVIRFLPTFLSSAAVEIDVEPGTSIQCAAEDAGVPMGDACGGNCACSTCHVHMVEGFDGLDEMEDDEDDVLGKADDVRDVSRLGCQVYVSDADLVVRITRESQIAFINEHPEHRDRVKDVVT